MTYNILDFGAISDGKTNNSKAIQEAINKASETNGTVLIPKGSFLSGTITLKSNITLYLDEGATLISSLNPKEMTDFSHDFVDDNQDTGWEGGCFILGKDLENVTIDGKGVIDGRGRECFIEDNLDDGFFESPLNVVPLRPRMTFLEHIRNLTIRNVTFHDAAFWTLHLAGCEKVRIENITIDNMIRGVNNDGIDPDCCKDVYINGCDITCGDDAIVLKTTGPMFEKYGECSNILIENCKLHSRSSAIKIGTETYGDIHDVIVRDCEIAETTRGIGIWSRDGGNLYQMSFSDIKGTSRAYHSSHRDAPIQGWWGNGEPIFISAVRRENVERLPGKIHDLTFTGLDFTSEGCLFMAAEEDNPIENIIVKDSKFTFRKLSKNELGKFDERPSIKGVYPHSLPEVYLRDTKNVVILSDLKLDDSMKGIMEKGEVKE